MGSLMVNIQKSVEAELREGTEQTSALPRTLLHNGKFTPSFTTHRRFLITTHATRAAHARNIFHRPSTKRKKPPSREGREAWEKCLAG